MTLFQFAASCNKNVNSVQSRGGEVPAPGSEWIINMENFFFSSSSHRQGSTQKFNLAYEGEDCCTELNINQRALNLLKSMVTVSFFSETSSEKYLEFCMMAFH